eukprot:TRINITY_DN28856_c0_g1_i1.p1 TRINITY_DN28856_c0_g1~~TRINITY_DN28856_c0_g1_i1.p1  ORF type:complete len:712 (+),score=208.52 TRINITY_DN28856_c0_g1_i1:245-2137(+)
MLGFVQFADIWAARTAMAQFFTDPPSIVLKRPNGYHPLNLVYSDKPEIRAQNKGRITQPQPPVYTNSRLLLVVLKELTQMVTIDELFWVFTQVARVEKISSFTKDSKNQIVVQFETSQGAEETLAYFSGKYLPSPTNPSTNLCFLAIVPSKLSQLTFRNQDGRNRDYTEANRLIMALLNTNGAMARNKQLAEHEWQALCRISSMNSRAPLYDFIWGQHRWGEGWLVPRQEASYQGRVPLSKTSTMGQVGMCMHISGLPADDSIVAEQLWSLCGLYGAVKAVKMLYKYRGCAVVQFAEPEGCDNAIKHLHGLEFKGRTWDAKVSRQPNATHWNGASEDLQKRMVSENDPQMRRPPVCDESGKAYPSKFVCAWGVPYDVPNSTIEMAVIVLVNVAPVAVVHHSTDAGRRLIEFRHLDEGVMAVIKGNGAVVDGLELRLCFAEKTAGVPRAAMCFRMNTVADPAMLREDQKAPSEESKEDMTTLDDDDLVDSFKDRLQINTPDMMPLPMPLPIPMPVARELEAEPEQEEEPPVRALPEPVGPVKGIRRRLKAPEGIKRRVKAPEGIPRPAAPPSPSAQTETTPHASPAISPFTYRLLNPPQTAVTFNNERDHSPWETDRHSEPDITSSFLERI